jgi:hypothetical protein
MSFDFLQRSCREGVRVKQEGSSESVYRSELTLFSRSSIRFSPPRLRRHGILDTLSALLLTLLQRGKPLTPLTLRPREHSFVGLTRGNQ